MQAELNVGPADDPLEREADRIADQVLAGSAHPAVGNASPRIQRFSGQANGRMDAAPASVHRTLASPGSPLNPSLRHDMEQRFGHDFSVVRVHSGSAAARSAQEVNANAYTVGSNIVFDTGRFAPGTHEGMRLLSHELTHVVQQSGAGPLDGARTGPAAPSTGPRFLQRDGKQVHMSLHPEETGRFSGSFKLPGGAGLLQYTIELRNVPALLLDRNNRSRLDIECEFGIRTILQEQLKSGPLPNGMPALHISVDAGYSKALKEGHVAKLVRRAGRAELRRAITQALNANIRPAPVAESPSFRKSAPVLAELADEALATFSPALEGSRSLLVDDTPSVEELLEESRRLGINVDPAPAPTTSAAPTDCLALLDTDPQAYIECEKRGRLTYADDIKKGTMSVTEPIAAGLEAVNPLDPVNLATGGAVGVAGAVFKVGKAYKATKVVKATRVSVYAARWGDEGAKLIERAISQRGSISSHFGKLPANYQVHHIVPVTALKKSEVVQAAVVDGFQFNNKVNAIALPRTVHMAYHNRYIELINERLQKWAADNPGFTPKQARDFLENSKVGIYEGGLVEEWRRNWISVL